MSQAYIPPSAGAVALGFAIPAADVVDVADQLLASGTAQHAYVGIQPGTLTPQIAEQLAVDRTSGVVVLEVVPLGPAATAGIRPGDVITAVNGHDTESAEDFIAAIRAVDPRRSSRTDRAPRRRDPADLGHRDRPPRRLNDDSKSDRNARGRNRCCGPARCVG